MTEYQVSVATGQVLLSAGRGAVTVSVTNNGAGAERIVLGVFPSAGAGIGPETRASAASWASVERPLRDIGAGATEQFAVSFAASGASAGSYPVRLIAYSATDAPEEAAATGQTVQVVVPDVPVAVTVAPRRPWWILAVIAVVVLAIGSVTFVLIRQKNPPVPVLPATSTTPPTPAACKPGYVPRLASPTDLVCVVPAVAAKAAFDNDPGVQKHRHPDPPGGAYGPETCAYGYVWREAFDGDTVCVVPTTWLRSKQENADAPLHAGP